MNLNSNSSCGCGKSGSDKSTPAAALTLANIESARVRRRPGEQPYEPAAALQHGTIFPCLDLPFYVTGGGK